MLSASARISATPARDTIAGYPLARPGVPANQGGGKWHDALAVARAFSNIAFDLCEIIELPV